MQHVGQLSMCNRMITVALTGALALAGLAGCGGSHQSGGSYSTSFDSTNEDIESLSSESSESSITEDQTAPMPEALLTEGQMLGKWSPDPDAMEPHYIDFFYCDGRLYYFYYRELLGNGNGIGIGKTTSEFEYDQGIVSFYGNQGNCYCLRYHGNGEVAVSFYISDVADGVITNQVNGEQWRYVGASTEEEHYLYDVTDAAGY